MHNNRDLTMKISKILKRIISGDKAIEGGTVTRRNAIVWIFIAVVALFLTNTSGDALSLFDKPLPLPPELGLE
jgi:hypothetical protein